MKPKIIITIDAETGEKASKSINGFENFFLGKFGNQNFGAELIAKICNKYNITADFFCNVYESKIFGEDKLEQLINDILNLNQNIQLHTHPGFYFDKNRRNLYEYNLAEQTEILKIGRDLIKKWINEKIN